VVLRLKHLLFVFAAVFFGTLCGAIAEPIRGAGSTFAAPAIVKWAQNYRKVRADGGDFASGDWAVDYELLGSLGGMLRLSQPEMDFAATDAPLSSAELTKRGFIQFPFVIGGVAVVVNLDGIASGQLKLSPELIADIYLGKITNWSDNAIKAINPGVLLPDLKISVVHRVDGSGTTQTFTEYLAFGSADWRSKVGSDVLVRWPTGTGADGSQAIVSKVRSTRGAIGYVEYGQVRRAGLTYVQVQNRTGQFVKPEAASFQATASVAKWGEAKDFYLQLTDTTCADTYPMTAATFALVPKIGRTANRQKHTIDFFRLSLDAGDDDVIALGYIPVPQRVVDQIKSYWASQIKSGS
jgi:phosphate transport system substrate-binding protein